MDIATTFPLQAQNASTSSASSPAWREGLALPAGLPGSGSLSLAAGVGHLAALQAVVRQLAGQVERDGWVMGVTGKQ